MTVLTTSPVSAETVPPAGTPATVSSDALPTWQIDGVVWEQVTVGNVVYATGSFANARPPGTAAGDPSQVARANLLAYDITTGNLIMSFNHSLNAQGLTIAASPDGSRVYVAGDFTKVDGIVRNHIAAFDTATGALDTSFAPTLDSTVRTVTATNATVYAGGDFASANGVTVSHLAAFSATDGSLLSFAPTTNATVTAMVVAPDQSRLIIAGRFTTIDSASHYGIGAVDAITGAIEPWSASFPILDAGVNAAITDLITDGINVYGTSYVFGTGGNFEGRFSADPDTGNLIWLESCHGDDYSAFIVGQVLYSAGHVHDCSDISSFDQTNNPQRAVADTTYATGVEAHNNNTNNANYHDFGGYPTPTQLPWYPTITPGTFTGQGQAAWSVTGNSNYVAFGGEFPSVNGVAQQGLVRFAVSSIAPNKDGPQSHSGLTPVAVSNIAGSALVSWLGTWDDDNQNLTYSLYRDGGTTPIYTTTAPSAFYSQPELSYLDVGLTPGSSHTYIVRVKDPFGNGFPTFASNPVTIASTGARSPYETAVTGDGAVNFWPLGESSGPAANDHVGGNNISLVSVSDATRGTPGPGPAGPGTATTFDGTSSGTGSSIGGTSPTSTITVEAWVKTTAAGGQIIDNGLSQSGASAIATDTLYLSGGQPYFTIWTPTGYRAIHGSAPINDGQWHYVAGTMSSTTGTVLYVDGAQVATDAATTTIRPYLGYWRLAGDTLAYLPAAPASPYFAGSIADVAVYPTALTPAQVAAHFAGNGVTDTAPVAAFTSSCTALTCALDGSSSHDPDGSVANWSWNYGDGTSGVGSTASHSYATGGTYTVTLTVTDNGGLTNTTSGSVTVAPNQAPVASFTSSCTTFTCSFDGSASHDPDGVVTAYAWNFGDGTTGTGATASHTYPIAGDYSVTLTVTDNATPPLTNATTQTVSPRPPPNQTVLANDTFNRTVSNGLGTADTGGPWTASFATNTLAVTPGTATMLMSAAGQSSGARLGSVSSTDSDTTATVSVNKAGTGSGILLYVVGRRTNTNQEYRGRVRVAAGNQILVALTKLNGSSSDVVIAPDTAVTGLSYTPGTQLNLRLQVVGTNPTTLRFSAWRAGTSQPAGWEVTATDSTAALQSPGAVGMATYLFTNATNAPVTESVTAFSSVPTSATPPSASFTASCTQLVCSTDASASTGTALPISYAWSFGDGQQATGVTASHTYAQGGTIRITLTVTDASGLTSVATQTVTLNKPPLAVFTSNCTSGLTCTFDATASSDPDGTLSSLSWDFGDGTNASGATAAHTYATGNTYTVVLTVTDNGGASTSNTQMVVVPPPNKPPTASFTVSCSVLTCSVDGSASTDPDGTVASWAWNFGDGATATGSAASHTYQVAGDYTISLQVTDNQGGVSPAVTQVVSPRPPANPLTLASDTFNRSVTNGLGTADSGGAWVNNFLASDLSVTPGSGLLKMHGPGITAGAVLNGVSSTDEDVTATISLNKTATGLGTFVYLIGRHTGTNLEYRGRFKVVSSGQVVVAITRLSGTSGGTIIAPDTLISGLTYTAGLQVKLRLQVTGTNPTTIRFSAWKATATQPSSWQVTTTDSTASLQVPGSVGVATYVDSGATNTPITESVLAFGTQRAQTPPTAAFTPNCSGGSCTFDASASTDAQGPISSYAWSFGDGATTTSQFNGTNHTYASSGTYTVTLTVTDSVGFTSVTSQTIVVDQPPVASFTATCSATTTSCAFDGTASSDPDGPIASYSWDFGDGFGATGPTPSHTYTSNGPFTAVLTVTDNLGGTGTASRTVSFSTGNQSPVSTFTASCTNLVCSFDGSTSSDPDGTVVGWSWAFGDGATATGATTSHTYASAGAHNVTLTVTDNGGATNASTQVATTRAPNQPVAAFIASCGTGLNCSFDGSGSSDPGGTLVSWAWNFGDGSTASGLTASHTYAAGTYTASFTVTDNFGATNTATKTFTVPDQPPIAVFTSSCTLLACSFDGSGSSDPDGTATGFAWTFGDGATASGATTSHTYAAGGAETVTLTVTDDQGATTSISHVVTPNQPPIAAFTSSCTALACSFDGSGSSDPDGTLAGYAWTFGDGATATGATTSHSYAASGPETVTLTVTDNQGATTSISHQVAPNLPPVAAFTSSCNLLSCSFNGSTSSDSDGSIASYAWNFGDGSAAGSGATPSHTYAAGGTDTVTLTVTDNQGATGTVSHSVTVTAPSLIAAFTPTCTNLSCSFDGSGSSDAGGTITSYAWAFGDGATGSGVSASHTYAAAGDYVVTLTVTDNHGTTAASTATVSPRPPANPVNTPYVTDTFNRTVSGGLGTADVGGAWTTVGTASSLSVAPGTASFLMPATGSQVGAYVGSVAKTDNETDATLGLDKAATGSGVYVYVAGRRVSSTNEYDARVRFGAGHAVGIAITKLAGSSTVVVVSPEVILTGVSYSPGMSMKVRFQATGLNPTTLRLKVWVSTAPEPTAWQMVTTDTTATIQHTGSVGLSTYLSGSSTNAPVTLLVSSFGAGPTAAAPTAAFTASCSGLACNVDGSTSTDPSGSLTSYQWSWGDGTITAGTTSTHTYAAAGTYRITLTVTNSFGWTNVTTNTVVVPA